MVLPLSAGGARTAIAAVKKKKEHTTQFTTPAFHASYQITTSTPSISYRAKELFNFRSYPEDTYCAKSCVIQIPAGKKKHDLDPLEK